MSAIPEDNVGGCDDAQGAGGVLNEEEEIALIRKNRRHYRGSDIPAQALSALVSLQGLSISDFDQALEEVIPEDILSEPPEADNPTICSEVSDDGLLSHDSARQEVTRVVSHASLTLEGGLPRENADPSNLAPMDVADKSSSLEVATAEGPALEGGAGSDPAPKGIGAGSPYASSMDVHVGSPLVRSEQAAVTHPSMTLAGLVTLEASESDARSLLPADGVKVPPIHAFDIIPVDLPSSSNASTLPALGLPRFLSNLQVNQLSLFYCSFWQTSFFTYLSMVIGCSWRCICPTEILQCSYPRSSLVSDEVESSTAPKTNR
jgi:hypothetical protein